MNPANKQKYWDIPFIFFSFLMKSWAFIKKNERIQNDIQKTSPTKGVKLQEQAPIKKTFWLVRISKNLFGRLVCGLAYGGLFLKDILKLVLRIRFWRFLLDRLHGQQKDIWTTIPKEFVKPSKCTHLLPRSLNPSKDHVVSLLLETSKNNKTIHLPQKSPYP